MTVRDPDAWKKHMARLEETSKAGIRAFPLCSPNRTTQTFTMKNCQVFRGTPTWHPILLASDDEKLRAYSDAAPSRWYALGEALLCVALFVACAMHVRLRFKNAKAAAILA